MLPIIRPDVTFDEVADDVRSILDSGLLTGGPFVARFERLLADRLGVAEAVATTSATTALHLSLVAIGVQPGDEVLVSDFTFPATGNVVVQLGARPVLVDSRTDAFDLDVEVAAGLVTSRTRAIVPVDPFGQPADYAAVKRLAEESGIAVVQDAACALGSVQDGVPCGSWPWPTCFSFHPRKVVTTGEGGVITTDDPTLAERLRLLRSHGGVSADVGMTFLENGFNYRLAEVPAAIGLAQLVRLDAIIADRRATAARYEELLASVEGVVLRLPGDSEQWSYQSFVVLLDDGVDRDSVVTALRSKGIETTLGTYALHSHPAFARFGYHPGDLPNSWLAQQQSLTLPLLPSMSASDLDRVVDGLSSAVAASPLAAR